tara:strand:+ start:2445 stop:4658 length:2214 start_codon:yes stop_codon:yes gene_type:complete
MALRRTAEFQNDKGIFYKLEIYDSLTSSPSALTLQLGASGFQLKYETQDRTRFSGVIPSSCTFDIIPRNSTEQAVIDDITSAPYGRFQLVIYKDNTTTDGSSYNLYWVGNILTDVSSRQNLSFFAGTQQTITATDGLAELVDVSVSTHFLTPAPDPVELTSSQRFLLTIQKILRDSDILNTSQYWGTTDNFLQTQVNWYTGQMPTPAADKDPLFFSGCFARAFKKIENEEEVFINTLEALDRIMKCWGARLILSDGMWRVIQPNGYSDTNFERTYRKGNTTVISSSAVQLKTNAGIVLGGGTFDSLHPVQKVETFYDLLYELQLLQFSIPLWMTKVGPALQKTDPPTTTVNGGNSLTGGLTFSQSIGLIQAQTDATLEWNLLFRPELIYYDGQYLTTPVAQSAVQNDFIQSRTTSGAGSGVDLRCQLLLKLRLVGDSGTTYHLYMTQGTNGGAKEWTTSAVNVGFPVIFSENNANDYFNAPAAPNPRSGSSIGGTHPAIPESGELFIEGFARFRWQDPNGFSASDEVDTADVLFPNSSSGGSSGTIIKGLAIGMEKPDGNNYYLRYLVNGTPTAQQLISAEQGTAISNAVLKLDPAKLGSGPTAQTPTRIITFDAAGNGDDGTASTWQVFQETTGDGTTGTITKILCKEVLAGRKTGVDVYNGSLQTDKTTNYEYHLAFDNISSTKIFVPNEINYNANEGIWDGQWIETDLDASGQNYTSNDIAPGENDNATFTSEW